MLNSKRNKRVCLSISHVKEHVFARNSLLALDIAILGCGNDFDSESFQISMAHQNPPPSFHPQIMTKYA